ncbi:MAG: PIG-L family deacetylase [Deltaproteobacteria bacterium]|nr:PIG-L family deacetylase [Deltaproteobacteria bacterium]
MRAPRGANVVYLAPHPDDPESAAVTLRLLSRRGCAISEAVVCLSPAGVEDAFLSGRPGGGDGEPETVKARIRRDEQTRAAELFGLSAERLVFLGLDESGSLDRPAGVEAVFRYLAAAAPDVVVLPCGRDSNRTHVRVWEIFRGWAAGEAARSRRPVVGLYHEDPKTLSLRDDLFVCFGGETAEWKRGLLRAHASQQERNLRTLGAGFDERILGVNRAAAERAGRTAPEICRWAEAFEIEVFDTTERERPWHSKTN